MGGWGEVGAGWREGEGGMEGGRQGEGGRAVQRSKSSMLFMRMAAPGQRAHVARWIRIVIGARRRERAARSPCLNGIVSLEAAVKEFAANVAGAALKAVVVTGDAMREEACAAER